MIGGVFIVMHRRSLPGHEPPHPHNAGTEHVGCLPTSQPLLALSANRRKVFGESHERWAGGGAGGAGREGR